VIQGIYRAIADYLAGLRAAGQVGRASKLLQKDRLAEAAELLERVRGRPASLDGSFLDVGHASTSLVATRMLSVTAAKLGDRPRALSAIAEGLALWREFEPHLKSESTRSAMLEWEAWAKRYEASREGG
jgi:hypothetical protein